MGPEQAGVPAEASDIVEVAALGKTLFARNTHGDIYFRSEGKDWRKLAWSLTPAPLKAMIADGGLLYLLSSSGEIHTVDAEGKAAFSEKIPDTMICQLPGTSDCISMQIHRYGGRFFIEAGQPYTDSTFPIFRDSLYNYHLVAGGGGAWSRMRWQTGYRPRLNLSFRDFWIHGDSILGASYQDGLWLYDGLKWDSLPSAKIVQYRDSNGTQVPGESIPIGKWGGTAVFQGTVYAAPWTGGLFRLVGGAWEKIPLKSKTNTGEIIDNDGLFNYGLDTLCGRLANIHGVDYWKPGAMGWQHAVDTASASAILGYAYPIASTFSLALIGDSLYAGYQAPIGSQKDPQKGGVARLNLRDAPWCEEAWARSGRSSR